MEAIQFQFPEALFALALLPVLLLLYLWREAGRKRRVARLGEAPLLQPLLSGPAPRSRHLRALLFGAAMGLLILAGAGPRRADAPVGELRRGIDMIIALDVSNSMLAADVAPNRLQRAKAFIGRLISNSPNDRIGLVLFAGQAYVQMPLTFDHAAARLFTSSASPAAVPVQGTSLSDALAKSGLAYDEEAERFRTLVLITDGENHDEQALEEAKRLREEGVVIQTVGIGSAAGSTLVDTATGAPRLDETGAPVTSKLNEALLQALASEGGGNYLSLGDPGETADALTASFAGIEKKALADTASRSFRHFYMYPLIPALLLLVLLQVLPSQRKKMPA